MYHRMCIVMESDFVFAGELANALEPIWEFLNQVISGPDGLGCFRGCSRLVCGCCSGNRWRMSAGLSDGDGHSSSSQLQVSHLRVDPGWWDQGCLQHTNMILPCGGKHQGNLVAK